MAKPRCETRWCDGGDDRGLYRLAAQDDAQLQMIMASVEVSSVRKSFGQFRGDSRRLDPGRKRRIRYSCWAVGMRQVDALAASRTTRPSMLAALID